jgi:hypothetical protein
LFPPEWLHALMVNADLWQLERREDGAVLVRVPSRTDVVAPLPDAVFAFRIGDPQYQYWDERLKQRELALQAN